MSLNQLQDPSTGSDAVTVRPFSTAARSVAGAVSMRTYGSYKRQGGYRVFKASRPVDVGATARPAGLITQVNLYLQIYVNHRWTAADADTFATDAHGATSPIRVVARMNLEIDPGEKNIDGSTSRPKNMSSFE